jgi:ribonuclease P protein component
MREAHVPTKQPQAKQDARLPGAHAHARWTGSAESTTRARPQTARGLTPPIRDRATFEALGRSRPTRRGPITMRVHTSADDDEPRVSYAIGRHVGGAVVRNRVRRRLRAAVRAHNATLQPGASYLFGAGREALTMPFEALGRCVDELLVGSVR